MLKVKLSIVIPIYNEAEMIDLLISKITGLKKLPKKYELILVSDGSTDGSEQIIKKLLKKNKKIKLIAFSRNFGQQVAIRAGLEHAKGEHVTIMDADLQDPPEKMIQMYQLALKQKIDIVYAIRQKRQENVYKQIAYKLFYQLYNFLSESPVNIDSGDFSVMSQRVVKELNQMPEKVKFMRGLRSWTGFSSLAFPVKRPQRAAGEAKYTFKKLLALAVNGITSTSTKPLKLAIFLGAFFSLLSILLVFVYLLLWVVSDLHRSVPGFATIVILILFFGGLQLFTLGIIGEYLATIFIEVKNRPNYIIKEKINF